MCTIIWTSYNSERRRIMGSPAHSPSILNLSVYWSQGISRSRWPSKRVRCPLRYVAVAARKKRWAFSPIPNAFATALKIDYHIENKTRETHRKRQFPSFSHLTTRNYLSVLSVWGRLVSDMESELWMFIEVIYFTSMNFYTLCAQIPLSIVP